jgi:hypothetical protein
MADKGTPGPGLKVITNGRTLPTEEAYDENSIHLAIATHRKAKTVEFSYNALFSIEN